MDNGLLRPHVEGAGEEIKVLILIVMDNGLLLTTTKFTVVEEYTVLILIVMDNGLLPPWPE